MFSLYYNIYLKDNVKKIAFDVMVVEECSIDVSLCKLLFIDSRGERKYL